MKFRSSKSFRDNFTMSLTTTHYSLDDIALHVGGRALVVMLLSSTAAENEVVPKQPCETQGDHEVL